MDLVGAVGPPDELGEACVEKRSYFCDPKHDTPKPKTRNSIKTEPPPSTLTPVHPNATSKPSLDTSTLLAQSLHAVWMMGRLEARAPAVAIGSHVTGAPCSSLYDLP